MHGMTITGTSWKRSARYCDDETTRGSCASRTSPSAYRGPRLAAYGAHPCRLEPVGAWTATSMHSRMSSWGTGRSKSSRLRTERVVVRQVWASMAPIVAPRRIHERLLHVIRCRRDLSRAARDSGLPQVPHQVGAEGAGPPPVPSLQGPLSDRRRNPSAAHRRRQTGVRVRITSSCALELARV